MIMIEGLTLFGFVFSIVYILRYILIIILELFKDTPNKIELNYYEQISIVAFLTYIITYIIT